MIIDLSQEQDASFDPSADHATHLTSDSCPDNLARN